MQALAVPRALRTTLRPTGRRTDARRGRAESQDAAFERALGVRSNAAGSAQADTASDLPILDVEWSALGDEIHCAGNAPHAQYARTCLLGRDQRPHVINYYA